MAYFGYLTYQDGSNFGVFAGAFMLYALAGIFYWLMRHSALSKEEDRPSQQT